MKSITSLFGKKDNNDYDKFYIDDENDDMRTAPPLLITSPQAAL